ncbi:MAG: hypothetical protein ABI833_21245 [Acidobacteriota bacterium]
MNCLILLLTASLVSADVLVLSANANQFTGGIFRFDQTGGFLNQFDTPSPCSFPYGLAYGPDGKLYTATQSQIDRFDPVTGKLLASFGYSGGAQGIALGPDGLLYISSFSGGNISRYNPADGSLVDVFATVNSPTGLTFGPDGKDVYVCSYGTSSVVKINIAAHTVSIFISDPGLLPPINSLWARRECVSRNRCSESRCLSNYQRAYWNQEIIGKRKTPLALFDYRPPGTSRDDFLRRYAFVDWSKTTCCFEGFTKDTLAHIFADE